MKTIENTVKYSNTGRQWDAEAELYHYRARAYDPVIGRFLQQDPVFSVNPYPYVSNNPVNYTDPFGLQPGEDCYGGLCTRTISRSSGSYCEYTTCWICGSVCQDCWSKKCSKIEEPNHVRGFQGWMIGDIFGQCTECWYGPRVSDCASQCQYSDDPDCFSKCMSEQVPGGGLGPGGGYGGGAGNPPGGSTSPTPGSGGGGGLPGGAGGRGPWGGPWGIKGFPPKINVNAPKAPPPQIQKPQKNSSSTSSGFPPEGSLLYYQKFFKGSYFDLNLALGYWLGVTGGVNRIDGKWCGYVGGGFVSPYFGVALTYAPDQKPTPGWNIGLQATYLISYQRGYSFGPGGGRFWEAGWGAPPGVSLTGYYVWCQ